MKMWLMGVINGVLIGALIKMDFDIRVIALVFGVPGWISGVLSTLAYVDLFRSPPGAR